MKSLENKILLSMIFLTTLLDVAVVSCKKNKTEPDNPPPANTVFIQGMAYSPSSVTVSKGTTVEWINKDNTNHTVTSDTPAFESGTMGSGQSFKFTFSTTGTFRYHCTFHSSMHGTVIVQ